MHIERCRFRGASSGGAGLGFRFAGVYYGVKVWGAGEGCRIGNAGSEGAGLKGASLGVQV